MGHNSSLCPAAATGQAAPDSGAGDGHADAGDEASGRDNGAGDAPDHEAVPAAGTPRDGGRLLVASNRGPLSFTMTPDGSLSARRGAGGLVSGLMPGLSSLAHRAEVVWICAALSDADRAAARQDPEGSRFGVDAGGFLGRPDRGTHA